jgi:hypothetical protein
MKLAGKPVRLCINTPMEQSGNGNALRQLLRRAGSGTSKSFANAYLPHG